MLLRIWQQYALIVQLESLDWPRSWPASCGLACQAGLCEPAPLCGWEETRVEYAGAALLTLDATSQVLKQLRERLRLKCAFMQLPVGLEHHHEGLVDLVSLRAYSFGGDFGETLGEVRIVMPGLHTASQVSCSTWHSSALIWSTTMRASWTWSPSAPTALAAILARPWARSVTVGRLSWACVLAGSELVWIQVPLATLRCSSSGCPLGGLSAAGAVQLLLLHAVL